MPKAILIDQPGPPEAMKWREVPMPEPQAGEVLVRHTAVGLNYIDTYHRSGLYTLPSYPVTPGMEAAGVVEKLGTGVQDFAIGDKVGYGTGPLGAYAQYRTIAAEKLAKIPHTIAPEIAAAVMLKGLTAHFLVRRTFIVGRNHAVLVHAAAGGVGLLLCQMAKRLGAIVIGTVSSEEKAKLALESGCDVTINYKTENVAARIKEMTGGIGVHAVYDSVGKDTYTTSLDCLMRFGILVSYGNTTGPLPPIDALDLSRRGSLFFTRPSLVHYMEDPAIRRHALEEIFGMLEHGIIKATVGQSYYLSDAVSAHRDLEAGKTHGSTILIA